VWQALVFDLEQPPPTPKSAHRAHGIADARLRPTRRRPGCAMQNGSVALTLDDVTLVCLYLDNIYDSIEA